MKKHANKLEHIKTHLNQGETNEIKPFEKHYNTYMDKDSQINLPQKIKNIFIEDYYNTNILKKFSHIPATQNINSLIEQYLKSKNTKYNLIKKNDLLNKINPHFKLITSSYDDTIRAIDLEIQMIYINDIFNNLKSYMSRSIETIIYSLEEKSYTFNLLDIKNESILNLLGVNHLLRFILQTPVIVKYYYGISEEGEKKESVRQFLIFKAIIEDFIIFLDKIL